MLTLALYVRHQRDKKRLNDVIIARFPESQKMSPDICNGPKRRLKILITIKIAEILSLVWKLFYVFDINNENTWW